MKMKKKEKERKRKSLGSECSSVAGNLQLALIAFHPGGGGAKPRLPCRGRGLDRLTFLQNPFVASCYKLRLNSVKKKEEVRGHSQ